MISLGLDIDKFVLKDAYFDQKSTLHGQGHTCRVMFLCLLLGDRLDNVVDTRRALCAAFIHDMSRQHDGYCTEHGDWAVERKLPDFIGFFRSLGMSDEDLEAIALAVGNHSVKDEITENNPYYATVAILKDADALDRIRLGSGNLNPEYLRYNESHSLIKLAKRLYYKTAGLELYSLRQVMEIGEVLLAETD